MNIDKQKLLSAILNNPDAKINKNAIKQAENGDISAIAAGLDEQSRKKLGEALSDSKKAKEILNSKEAREIMQKLLGGDKNG